MQIYFTAQTVASSSSEKPKASNVLVPTCLAYGGGEVEFPLEWNTEVQLQYTNLLVVTEGSLQLSTRLMIIRGDFDSLSLAVYGNLVSESSNAPVVSSPFPQALEALKPIPHNPPLDPANSNNPTFLAKELLSQILRAPRLADVVRFVFCLKPSKEDWSRSNFPFYANWDQLPTDLDEAIVLLSRPLPEDTPSDAISNIAHRIKEAVAHRPAVSAIPEHARRIFRDRSLPHGNPGSLLY